MIHRFYLPNLEFESSMNKTTGKRSSRESLNFGLWTSIAIVLNRAVPVGFSLMVLDQNFCCCSLTVELVSPILDLSYQENTALLNARKIHNMDSHHWNSLIAEHINTVYELIHAAWLMLSH